MSIANPVRTPFDEIRLSLDPATLDHALGKRQVRAIEVDGSLTYEEERTTNDKLTEQLGWVWNEYPNGLLDISEDKLEQSPADGLAVKNESKEVSDDAGRDATKMMDSEDMEKLRSDVFGQLNDARNELWFVLELAKTLAASSAYTSQPPPPPAHAAIGGVNTRKGKQKPNARANESENKTSITVSGAAEPPVLPPGTYSTTPSSVVNQPTHAQVHELELVLAAKQQALDECSALIDSAVSELQMMASAGDRFWRDIGILKDGRAGKSQWAIIPKPDFGRLIGEGAKAKDVIIPYAIDEAPRGMRSHCLAAFDLDPTKQDALTFGARSNLRLRATVKDTSGVVLGSTPVPRVNSVDVMEQMEAAQMEAFDEELFNELRAEASRINRNEITSSSVSIPAAVGYMLTFELYDTRKALDTPTLPLCDLILSSARLNLLNLHRYRKAYLIGSTMSAERAPPFILQPVVQALSYRQLCQTIDSILANFARTLSTAGIETSVMRDTSTGNALPAVVQAILVGAANVNGIASSYKLEVDGCPGARIDTFAPFKTQVALPRATFELTNPDDLSHILSEALSAQLLRLAASTIRNHLLADPVKDTLFFDELEDIVHLGGLGYLRISIPPPFHTILCHVDPLDANSSINSAIEVYDARQAGDLQVWLKEIAFKIRGSEE
ncbi:hypothetical protein IAT40_001337 [Kwoniella sp. CBS 6097]